MCRLFIANQKDYYLYDRSHGILKLMEHLEKQCGGHGNGFALVKDKQIIKYAKGQSLTNEEIYHTIKGVKNWDYVVYHTRIASIGDRSDSNCHPFIDSNNAIAMNGTAYEFNDVAEVMEKTDTELIFKLVKDLAPTKTTQALAVLGAIFVGFSKGKPYAVKGRGDLACYTKGCGSFHASSFPKDVPHKTLDKGYIWLNGTVIQKQKPVVVDDWRSWGSSKSYHTAAYSDYSDSYYAKAYSGKLDEWEDEDDTPTDEWQEGYLSGHDEGYTSGFEDGQACVGTGHNAAEAYDVRKRG